MMGILLIVAQCQRKSRYTIVADLRIMREQLPDLIAKYGKSYLLFNKILTIQVTLESIT